MKTIIIRTDQHKSHALRLVEKIPVGDTVYEVVIQEHKAKRSLEQNSLYWGRLNQIASQMVPLMDGEWHSPEVWHTYFRQRFLPTRTEVVNGKEILVLKSTTELSIPQFSDYLLEIESWAIEQGVFLQ